MAKVMLKRIGTLSAAKWLALLMAIFGLPSGLYQGVSLLILNEGGIRNAIYYTAIGFVASGVMGFIATVTAGLIYNGLAGALGGMVLELESIEAEFLPPPPPKDF